MITQVLVYAVCGLGLFAIGLRATLLEQQLLRRVLALNICGAGVFLTFVAIAYRGPDGPADPIPHALVLTGIVVAVSAMAMAVALGRRLAKLEEEHE